jgi:hypothetical protein
MAPLYGIGAIVHSYGGKGKPKGCLELVNAVLKGKPHVFESWAGFIIIIIIILD